MKLEHIVDESMFEGLRQARPKLVDAISNLLAMGQTPAQIERHIQAKFGSVDIATQVRHAAEHLQRIG